MNYVRELLALILNQEIGSYLVHLGDTVNEIYYTCSLLLTLLKQRGTSEIPFSLKQEPEIVSWVLFCFVLCLFIYFFLFFYFYFEV